MGDAKGSGLPAVFLHTSDGGVHWASVNDSSFGYFSGDLWRRLDFISPSTGYFFESGQAPQRIYKTTDGCAHWAALPLPDTIYVQILKWYNDRIGLVKGFWWENPTVNGQVVARTLDGGTNWEVYDNTTMGWGNDFEFVPGDPAKVWYTDDKGLYYSADTGRTWLRQRGWQMYSRDIVLTDPLHGWVLGDDSLLLYTTTGGLTGVQEDDPPIVTGFSLEQNYPNPFNSSTTIRYALPQRSHVTLSVFNTLGQQVATLVNGEVEAGYHELHFNAGSLASGLYIYRLSASSWTQTRTMLFIK